MYRIYKNLGRVGFLYCMERGGGERAKCRINKPLAPVNKVKSRRQVLGCQFVELLVIVDGYRIGNTDRGCGRRSGQNSVFGLITFMC